MSADIQVQLEALGRQLERLGVEHGTADNAAVVVLPSKKKLETVVGLILVPDFLRVEAFIRHAVEKNHRAIYKWLLQCNRRLFGIGYATDAVGDIYLVGQLPAQLFDDDLDHLLSRLLETADGDFNQIPERGSTSATKREWERRVDHGENLANLEWFRHMVE